MTYEYICDAGKPTIGVGCRTDDTDLIKKIGCSMKLAKEVTMEGTKKKNVGKDGKVMTMSSA